MSRADNTLISSYKRRLNYTSHISLPLFQKSHNKTLQNQALPTYTFFSLDIVFCISLFSHYT